MIEIKDKKVCCGCSACANICPKKCIKMKPDEEGFLYPEINSDLCVNCNLCNKACPMLTDKKVYNAPKAYGCYNKDNKIRERSTSGGMFHILCEYIISQGGVVFGAAFDSEFNVCHAYAETMQDCEKFKGSKYVQSVIGNCYKKAKDFLDAGRLVLFTGTPCQIAGLSTFLNNPYENLFTQDIVCHSVPSPKVWNEYKKSVKGGREIAELNFRDKKTGWKDGTFEIAFKDESRVSGIYHENAYMKGFLNGLYSRPSCYDCKFSSVNRQSDITLADYWGVSTFNPELFDDKGTSLVLVNTPKGKKLFDYAKKQLVYKKVPVKKAVWYNSAVYSSAKPNPNRDAFIVNKDKSFERRVKNNLYRYENEAKAYKPTFYERIKFKLRRKM